MTTLAVPNPDDFDDSAVFARLAVDVDAPTARVLGAWWNDSGIGPVPASVVVTGNSWQKP